MMNTFAGLIGFERELGAARKRHHKKRVKDPANGLVSFYRVPVYKPRFRCIAGPTHWTNWSGAIMIEYLGIFIVGMLVFAMVMPAMQNNR